MFELLALVHFLSQMNTIYTSSSRLSKIPSNITFQTTPNVSLYGFRQKFACISNLSHTCCMSLSSQHIWFHHINII